MRSGDGRAVERSSVGSHGRSRQLGRHDGSGDPMRTATLRPTAWFAVGLVCVVLLALASSTTDRVGAVEEDESTFVPVTPVRILDTRDPVNVGLDGPFVSPLPQLLRVTGAIATTQGTQTVVPEGATGVVLNVTAVMPTAAGFLSIRPAGLLGAPTTSSLNFEANSIVPNAVTVNLPTTGEAAGRIEIVYDAFGELGPTTDVLVDLVGYHVRGGLQDLAARLAAVEAQLAQLSSGQPIVMTYGPAAWKPISQQNFAPTTFQHRLDGSYMTGDGHAMMSLAAPMWSGGVDYALTEVTYCIHSLAGGAQVAQPFTRGFTGTTWAVSVDFDTRTQPGCYSYAMNQFVRDAESFQFHVEMSNGGNGVLGTVTARFEPR